MNVPTAGRSVAEDLQQTTTTVLIAGDTMSSWTRLGEGQREKKEGMSVRLSTMGTDCGRLIE